MSPSQWLRWCWWPKASTVVQELRVCRLLGGAQLPHLFTVRRSTRQIRPRIQPFWEAKVDGNGHRVFNMMDIKIRCLDGWSNCLALLHDSIVLINLLTYLFIHFRMHSSCIPWVFTVQNYVTPWICYDTILTTHWELLSPCDYQCLPFKNIYLLIWTFHENSLEGFVIFNCSLSACLLS